MASRIVHLVRCKNPNDSSTYLDVIVTDGISFTGKNGDEVVLISPASNAQPTIIDQTSGGNGITSPDPTRVSHMIEVDGQDDTGDGGGGQDNTGNGFYAEVLDGASFTSRNGDEVVLLMPTSVETAVVANPFNLAYVAPNDTTSMGGGTRGGTITRVDDGSSNSNGGTQYVNGINPNATSNYVTVYQSIVFCFRGKNGDAENIVLDAGATVENGGLIDETIYTVDDQGNQVPPDNRTYDSNGNLIPGSNLDPNVYVAFSPNASGIHTGDVLINQGMLWQIVKASFGGYFIQITLTTNGNDGTSATVDLLSPNVTLAGAFSDIGIQSWVLKVSSLPTANDPNGGVLFDVNLVAPFGDTSAASGTAGLDVALFNANGLTCDPVLGLIWSNSNFNNADPYIQPFSIYDISTFSLTPGNPVPLVGSIDGVTGTYVFNGLAGFSDGTNKYIPQIWNSVAPSSYTYSGSLFPAYNGHTYAFDPTQSQETYQTIPQVPGAEPTNFHFSETTYPLGVMPSIIVGS